MNSKVISGVVISALVIIGIIFLISSKAPNGILYIEKGLVQIDRGDGYTPATNGMQLSVTDRIKTDSASKATIVLADSIIVDLKENTVVNIDELTKDSVKITQNVGTTWNKFMAITGIKSFEIETPTTVATVRGTGYEIGTDSVVVGEGTVETLADGTTYMIKDGKKLIKENGTFFETNMTEEDYERILVYMEDSLFRMKDMRNTKLQIAMKKHPIITKQVLKKYNTSKEEIWNEIERIDSNNRDIDDLIEKKNSMVTKFINADYLIALTEEIRLHNRQIDSIKE